MVLVDVLRLFCMFERDMVIVLFVIDACVLCIQVDGVLVVLVDVLHAMIQW